MDKTEAELNQAAYHDFLAILNEIFREALPLGEGGQPPEADAEPIE